MSTLMARNAVAANYGDDASYRCRHVCIEPYEMPWLGDVDAIADEIEVFLTGRKSRPRRRASFGVDALSRREREVALLASHGETAAEIASRLVMSKRTVESHLVTIYNKLGIESKTELIRRASELGI